MFRNWSLCGSIATGTACCSSSIRPGQPATPIGARVFTSKFRMARKSKSWRHCSRRICIFEKRRSCGTGLYSDHLPQVLWCCALCTVERDGARVVPLGKAFARVITDQPVVVVDRRWQIEQNLQQHMNGCCAGQISATDHMCD